MKFEWDEHKNKINQEKHGVSFEEAEEVFDDALQISKLDKRFNRHLAKLNLKPSYSYQN